MQVFNNVEPEHEGERVLTIWPGHRLSRPLALLWCGEGISLLGDQLHLVALTWSILEVTGSPQVLGQILALVMLIRAICLVPGGMLADRFAPQRVLVAVNLTRTVLGTVLTFCVFFNQLAVWHFYLFGVGFALLDALFQPTFLALPPLLVKDHALPAANALLQATRRCCEMLGPALGGALLKLAGAGAAFGADTLSFAVSALFFSRLGLANRRPAAPSQHGSSTAGRWRQASGELFAGFALVLRHAELRFLIMAIALVNLLAAGPLAVGVPALAHARFAGDPLAFGLLLSAFGAGALGGTLLASFFRAERDWLPWISAIILIYAVCFLILHSTTNALPAALALTSAGAGTGFIMVLIFTRFQQQSATERRGRAMSVVVFASFSCAALSNTITGVLAERMLDRLFAGAGGLLLCVVAAMGLYRLVRRHRSW